MSRSTMTQNLSRRRACARLAAAAAVAITAIAAPRRSSAATPQPGSPPAAAKPPLVVGFVYVTPVGEAGWTYQHELGRRELVAQQGAGLVFATSFGYLDPALRVAAEFPAARFEHAGGYKSAPNLATYDARYYEARWLAGWLAGRTSKSGIAGYVAGFPVPEVVQGINAFALGMRAANPKATVGVVWLDTWFDPAKERDAA